MNVSWLNITMLQAGLTLADMLLQSEFFVTIRFMPSEARCSHYAKIKEAISMFFSIEVRLL